MNSTRQLLSNLHNNHPTQDNKLVISRNYSKFRNMGYIPFRDNANKGAFHHIFIVTFDLVR